MKRQHVIRIGKLLALLVVTQSSHTVLAERPAVTDEMITEGARSAFEHMERGEVAEAERRFAILLRHRPKHFTSRFGLGTVLIKQHKYEEAVEVLEALLEDHPEAHAVMNNLAWLYATAKDVSYRNGPRAVKLAQEAIFLQPRDYHLWNTLAEAHYISGDYERAARAAEQALRRAREQGAPAEQLQDYEAQAARSRKASEAAGVLGDL